MFFCNKYGLVQKYTEKDVEGVEDAIAHTVKKLYYSNQCKRITV